MTVREFVEACDDKEDVMFGLFNDNDGFNLLSITSKKRGERDFNKFLEKYGEKKIKSWNLHINKIGYLYSIVIERGCR